MTERSRTRKDFDRDLVICFGHPRYEGVPLVKALRDLRERRGEYV